MERKKVVLADDVELFLMLENTFFNRDEFEVITARGGRELLKIIKASNPGMVYMDLDMPEMSGDECCRILKSDETSRHIPIVIVSPTVRTEDVERCRLAGCDDIVTKPINRNDFMNTSRKFLQVRERGDKRCNVRIPVNFGMISGGIMNEYSIDLNTGGMFLATDLLLEAGTMLHMDFTLPGDETIIKCKAIVAWVNGPEARRKPLLPNGMGVRFLDLNPEEEEAIRKCIETGFSNPDKDS
jgi:uncharacterized protein (TIGR02266 family)